MRKLQKPILIILACLFTEISKAQDAIAENEPKDFMRSNDKIYVVAAIVLTILVGLIIYVYRLDRKITKLEKDQ